VTGADSDAVDEERAKFPDHLCGEIFRACGGTRVEEDEIMVAGGLFDTGTDGIEVIRGDGETRRIRAHGFDLCGHDERVVFEDVAAL
jgi:hypothetical protein